VADAAHIRSSAMIELIFNYLFGTNGTDFPRGGTLV
jgi:hypothetical protein